MVGFGGLTVRFCPSASHVAITQNRTTRQTSTGSLALGFMASLFLDVRDVSGVYKRSGGWTNVESCRLGIHKEAMHVLQGEQFVNLERVVAASRDVIGHERFNPFALDVGSRQRLGIEQHLLDVPAKVIPIPQPEMKEFVPSEKQPLEMKTAQTTIELDEPLRHPVVVGVFSLAHELDP